MEGWAISSGFTAPLSSLPSRSSRAGNIVTIEARLLFSVGCIDVAKPQADRMGGKTPSPWPVANP